MKKLMIAAAAAAMVGGVYAYAVDTECIGCGGWIKVNPVTPVYVEMNYSPVPGHIWDLTIKAKTLVKKGIKCKTGCEECGDSDSACYYVDGSRTFNGVAWTCYEPCLTDDWAGDDVQESKEVPQMLFWETKSKLSFGYVLVETFTKVVDGVQYFSGMPTIQNVTVDGTEYLPGESFRYGKKAEKAAWGVKYEGESWKTSPDADNTATLKFDAVALGSIKKYKGKGSLLDYIVIDKATGGVVGSVSSCLCDEYGAVLPVCYEDFDEWCVDIDNAEELKDVPFYGTINVKYNSKKSAALRSTPLYLVTAGKVFPKYCFWDEDAE